MTEQPKPTGELSWMTYTKGETEIWVRGASSIVFDGPDREANARLFIRAQHMDKLVEAARRFRNLADCVPGPDLTKAGRDLDAILAEIEGGK